MDKSKKRIQIVFIMISIAFLMVLGAVLKLQLFPNPKTVELSKQYIDIKDLPPKRGDILDRNGNPLAITVEYDRLCVDPVEIKDKEGLIRLLSKELSMTDQELRPKIFPQDVNRRYVKIKDLLTREESKNLKAIVKRPKDYGLIFEPIPKRSYPNKSLASHVIGFIDAKADGKDGVEGYYDEYIKTASSRVRYQKDNKGNPIYSASNPELLSKSNDNVVYLTIDNDIQYQIERELKATVEKWKAASGTVIVMDPQTGEIISLANYPDYDPNDLKESASFAMKNRAVTDIFEPGSTFKIVTAGIALKTKITDLVEKFWDENGHFVVSGKKINEAKGHDYGWMTVETIIAKSSNIGSAKLGLKIGYSKFMDGIDEFGFGQKTGVDLPGEVSGLIQRKGGPVELSNMAFGQGISVTAMQMARIYSVIANGGYDVTPHIVKKIVNKNGDEIIVSSGDSKGDSLIPTDITKSLGNMLRSVVTEGTATSTDISGFDVGGKTGTAQKPERGVYSKDKYLASFFGFFPVSKPKYTLVVLIDEPKGGYFAALVAVPLFRNVANILIQNSSVTPEVKKEDPKKVDVKKEQVKAAPEPIRKPLISGDPNTVPDLTGLTLRDALKSISGKWDDIKVDGAGRVMRQVPAPGPRNTEDRVITIWLQ
jgi:cell division protein FtsI (penicillin-binding protein 3)